MIKLASFSPHFTKFDSYEWNFCLRGVISSEILFEHMKIMKNIYSVRVYAWLMYFVRVANVDILNICVCL